MSAIDDELLLDARESAQAVAYIQNALPQELKEKFTEEDIYYILDVEVEYMAHSGVLDAEPDEEGYIDIDLEAVAEYITKTAAEEKQGAFDPQDILLILQAEDEYMEALEEEEDN